MRISEAGLNAAVLFVALCWVGVARSVGSMGFASRCRQRKYVRLDPSAHALPLVDREQQRKESIEEVRKVEVEVEVEIEGQTRGG